MSYMAGGAYGGAPMARSWGSIAQSGALSVVYVIWNICACLIYPAALFVYFFGVGGTLTDPSKAYGSNWDWWRIWSVVFVFFAPPIAMFFVYQERKVTFSAQTGTNRMRFSRAGINILFYLFELFVAATGLYLATVLIWMGIDDFGNCSASPFCAGPGGGSKPTDGAIMALVALCVLVVLHIFFFFAAIYIHLSTRGIWAVLLSRLTGNTFALQSQIGDEVNDQEALLDAADGDTIGLVGAVLQHHIGGTDGGHEVHDWTTNAQGGLHILKGEMVLPASHV